MRRFALATIAAVVVSCAATVANAATYVFPCENFAKNEDGSWTVLVTTFIEGPDVKVQEGGIVQPGRAILGHDIAAIVAKACPGAVVAPPPPPPGAPPPPAPAATLGTPPAAATPSTAAPVRQQPLPFLSRLMDANGNLDVRQLTCGHIEDASAEEAELLLSWYSGVYSGSPKGRGINLARLRYNIRNVIDYCKANRDKRLSEVMERMLK